MSGLHPAGRQFRGRPIVLGAAAMLCSGALAILALGLADAVLLLLLSGALGGFVAGWSSPDPDAGAYERRAGGLHGMNAAGLGGLVLVVVLLALDLPASVDGGGVWLLFVASPFALLLYAAVGFVGGYVGIVLRLRSMA